MKSYVLRMFFVSIQLCIAVNNIEYVGLEMKPISAKLGTESILQELETVEGGQIGSQCRRTLETVMENAVENINNKIYEILEQVGGKVRFSSQVFWLSLLISDNARFTEFHVNFLSDGTSHLPTLAWRCRNHESGSRSWETDEVFG